MPRTERSFFECEYDLINRKWSQAPISGALGAPARHRQLTDVLKFLPTQHEVVTGLRFYFSLDPESSDEVFERFMRDLIDVIAPIVSGLKVGGRFEHSNHYTGSVQLVTAPATAGTRPQDDTIQMAAVSQPTIVAPRSGLRKRRDGDTVGSMESPSTKTEVIAEATVLNEELTVIQSQFTDKLHLWLKGLAGLRLTGSDATEIVNIVRATIRRAGRQMAYQDKPVNVLATNASHRKFASFQVRTVRPADPAVLHSATTFPELTTINIDHA